MKVIVNLVIGFLLSSVSLAQGDSGVASRMETAFNYAWNQEFEPAKALFAQILRENPKNADALSGMAYTLAWNGEYSRAKSFFNQLVSLYPENPEGEKGLAYVALWEGNEKEAIRRFEAMLDKNPFQDEYILAIAQAYASLGKQKQARLYFDSTLELAPQRSEITHFLQGVQESPALLEADVWAGYTNLQGTDKIGFRAAQVSWRPAKEYRVWARYDNSLTLDNFSLVQNSRGAGTVYLGGINDWNPRLTTKLEAGRRFWDEGSDQTIVQAEQIVFLEGGYAVKAGGFVALGAERFTEKMIFAGGNIPITSTFALEPVYFLSNTGASVVENRLLVSGKLRMNEKYFLDAGLVYGRIANLDQRIGDNILGTNMVFRLPLGSKHWLQFLFRYERQGGQNFTTAAMGIRYRLEK
ncbi:MAG: tetratricopeptide repeat protein [Bacteroidia bacterium]|nr:tetratricopeptide repeat protein [Bacteroidia bacterium]